MENAGLNKLKDKSENQNKKDQLQEDNTRNTNDKAHMTCFMMEYVHSKFRADTASDESQDKQSGFGDPPLLFFGTALINAIYNECSYIDANEINYKDFYQNIHNSHLPFSYYHNRFFGGFKCVEKQYFLI